MADFVQTTVTKTAVRELATPIADVATFSGIVQTVIAENPWLCTSYESQGATIPGVVKSREAYTARVLYQDADARTIGQVTAREPSVAGFGAAVAEIIANENLATAMGGTAARDQEAESYSATLSCHDANGETYSVTFSRNAVRISSYNDDAIRARIETWADGVAALG